MKKAEKIISIVLAVLIVPPCIAFAVYRLITYFSERQNAIYSTGIIKVIIIISVFDLIILSTGIYMFSSSFKRRKYMVFTTYFLVTAVNIAVVTYASTDLRKFHSDLASVTENTSDYLVFDKEVSEKLIGKDFVFPEKIPENVGNIKYHYRYGCFLDKDFDIYAEWSYYTPEEYKKEKERLSVYSGPKALRYKSGFVRHEVYSVYQGEFVKEIYEYNDSTYTIRYGYSYSPKPATYRAYFDTRR